LQRRRQDIQVPKAVACGDTTNTIITINRFLQFKQILDQIQIELSRDSHQCRTQGAAPRRRDARTRRTQ
jgi:hypothetical protein